MSKRKNRLSGSKDEVRDAAAELASFFPQLADVILGLYAAFLRDSTSDEDHVRLGILLCAVFEWLRNAGEPAARALAAASQFCDTDTPENRATLAKAVEHLASLLRRSPLTFQDEKAKTTRRTMKAPRTEHHVESHVSRGQHWMEPMTTYGLEQVARRIGVSARKIERWIESGNLVIAGEIDPSTHEYRFTDDDIKAVRSCCLRDTIESLFDDAEQWLQTPNQWLGGLCPNELIGTNREHLVINIVESIKHGAVA